MSGGRRRFYRWGEGLFFNGKEFIQEAGDMKTKKRCKNISKDPAASYKVSGRAETENSELIAELPS